MPAPAAPPERHCKAACPAAGCERASADSPAVPRHRPGGFEWIGDSASSCEAGRWWQCRGDDNRCRPHARPGVVPQQANERHSMMWRQPTRLYPWLALPWLSWGAAFAQGTAYVSSEKDDAIAVVDLKAQAV